MSAAAAAQLFPLQGLICFQVVETPGLHYQLVQLTDSLAAPPVPGAGALGLLKFQALCDLLLQRNTITSGFSDPDKCRRLGKIMYQAMGVTLPKVFPFRGTRATAGVGEQQGCPAG